MTVLMLLAVGVLLVVGLRALGRTGARLVSERPAEPVWPGDAERDWDWPTKGSET